MATQTRYVQRFHGRAIQSGLAAGRPYVLCVTPHVEAQGGEKVPRATDFLCLKTSMDLNGFEI